MNREATHRGYTIRYHCKDGRWTAHIRRPGGFEVMKRGFLAVSQEEGEAILLQKARSLIDRDASA